MISVVAASLSLPHDGTRQAVLQDISFSVPAKSSCAIIGPSGCGKTSLLFLLAGLRQPDSGTIVVSGQPRSGTILQNYGLFPWKTVADNIGLGLTIQGARRPLIEERVEALLVEMGLEGYGRHYPSQLSGGMQQRVAIARALAVEPDILFMDEPLSSLDALTRERLQDFIHDLWQRKSITIVLVTHSIEEAVFLGQQIIVLSQRPGRVLRIVDNMAAGTPGYRQHDDFFHTCTLLRGVLREEAGGPEA